jgi:hypothetical protein
MRRARPALCLALLLAALAAGAADDAPADLAAFTAELERAEGFVPILTDPVTGRVYLEIAEDLGAFIHQTGLPRGVGSNDLGLDRGQLADTRLAAFERIGTRVLLRERNTDWRADGAPPAERRAVEQAFATSVIAGFTVVAEGEGRYLIDYTDFLLTDTHDVAGTLEAAGEGRYAVDATRSAPWPGRTRAFPRNTELEAVLTLTGRSEGEQLSRVVPDPDAVTVHTHHSLVALPEPGYTPRAFHPMSGFWSHAWTDYAAPLGEDMVRRVIPRHRLEKRDPDAERSPPVEPIVYWLDPGTPEPVRSALLDGARWWNAAFEAIGYEDAFRVRLLPEDADPMDVRYNVIQWVHRSTRGWSYGMSVRDPRTGEILKGHVTLGSLRVRQDLAIARALTSPFETGDEAATDLDADLEADLQAMALQRIRQLSAHEIGHTLGLAHNYVASATPGGGSVMDYPHPRIRTVDGAVVVDGAAYEDGLGAWDLHAIAYGYSDVPGDEEAATLAGIVTDARAAGLRFLSDADARPLDSAHPRTHLWDNGTDAAAELRRLLAIRETALARMGTATLRPGEPYSELAERLVPVYYLHRYQTEAVAKLVGGLEYRYALRGDGADPAPTIVDPAVQRDALAALLETLDAGRLTLPADLAATIPPKAYGWRRSRESPPSRTGLTFDAVTPAEAAGEFTLSVLLDPGRLARVAQQHATEPAVPGPAAILDAVPVRLATAPAGGGTTGLITERLRTLAVEHLLVLAWGGDAVPEVARAARAAAGEVAERLERGRRGAPRAPALAAMIRRAAEAGAFERREDVPQLPPGSPI